MIDALGQSAVIDPVKDPISRIVRVLYLEPERFSRNKHFEAFKRPRVRFARRVARLLQSIRNDLLHTNVRVVVEDAEEGRVFVTQRALGRVVRRTLLTRSEFELLWQDPALAREFPELSTWLVRA